MSWLGKRVSWPAEAGLGMCHAPRHAALCAADHSSWCVALPQPQQQQYDTALTCPVCGAWCAAGQALAVQGLPLPWRGQGGAGGHLCTPPGRVLLLQGREGEDGRGQVWNEVLGMCCTMVNYASRLAAVQGPPA